VPVPATFRYEPKAVAQAPEVEWWKAFGDPALDGYIVEALEHNKNLQVAVANVEQAAGILTTARSPLFPQASYQGTGARQRYSERGGTVASNLIDNPQTTYQVLAGASWELDLWGRIRR
jgi:outer membrane protein, multidrug efflux system